MAASHEQDAAGTGECGETPSVAAGGRPRHSTELSNDGAGRRCHSTKLSNDGTCAGATARSAAVAAEAVIDVLADDDAGRNTCADLGFIRGK